MLNSESSYWYSSLYVKLSYSCGTLLIHVYTFRWLEKQSKPAGRTEVVQADFFTYEPEQPFDLIYDYTYGPSPHFPLVLHENQSVRFVGSHLY